VKGKTVLITGATDGIGKQTALELASRGAHVILHGRNADRGHDTVKQIRQITDNANVEFVKADFSSLKNVRALADQIQKKHSALHVLINNAGVYMNERRLSKDGFEMTFAVNHLAPFLLTNLLLDLLARSSPSRIINISSISHKRAQLDFDNLRGEKYFDAYGAYALSKLANVLFTAELATRLKDSRVTVNSVHPGVITTKLLYAGFGTNGSPVEEGAETPVYLATSREVENISGKYFARKREEEPSPLAHDAELRKKFWNVNARFVDLES